MKALLAQHPVRLPSEPLERKLLALWIAVGLGIVVALATAFTGIQPNATLAGITALLIVAAGRRVLLAWPTMLGAIVLIILLIPIRRYTIGGGLPVALEPYRLVIALVVVAWLAALLVDPDTIFKRSGLEGPILVLLAAILLSLGLNMSRATALSGDVLKSVSFFLSFVVVMAFVASIVRGRRDVDSVIMLLTLGGGLLALFALYEWRSGTNLFNSLDRIIPVLEFEADKVPSTGPRGDRVRAYASAQHSIALGAMLVMLVPLAAYLFRRSGRFGWMGIGALLTMGALATGSRTAVVMLGAELVVFMWLQRRATVRLLPLLLPLILCVQVVMPGTLGTFRAVFTPSGGLVAEEHEDAGQSGSGRLADVGPSLEEWARQPFVGQGFGTRLTSEDDGLVNAKILDDQWLSSLLEIGALGVFGLLWLFVRAIRRLASRARARDEAEGWLLACLASSITGFAIGMLTFDAFSFIQATFVVFILIGLSAVAVRLHDASPQRRAPGEPIDPADMLPPRTRRAVGARETNGAPARSRGRASVAPPSRASPSASVPPPDATRPY